MSNTCPTLALSVPHNPVKIARNMKEIAIRDKPCLIAYTENMSPDKHWLISASKLSSVINTCQRPKMQTRISGRATLMQGQPQGGIHRVGVND